MRARRGRGRAGADAMAGWLFADLLLVLFIVGLGSQMTVIPDAVQPPIEQQEEPQEEPSMRQKAEIVRVKVNPDALLAGDPREVARVSDAISAKTATMTDSQAVLVLAFGYSPDPDRGVAISESVASIITDMDAPFSKKTSTRAFWDGDPKEGTVRLEIFLLDNPPTP